MTKDWKEVLMDVIEDKTYTGVCSFLTMLVPVEFEGLTNWF